MNSLMPRAKTQAMNVVHAWPTEDVASVKSEMEWNVLFNIHILEPI